MRTLILSDLHLGSLSGSGLLGKEQIRRALLAELEEVDRLVLLGDVLELRHGPMREAMAAARPFFEELGSSLAGREIVITAGNHDHALVEPWLARRGEESEPPELAPEQLLEPAAASPALERIAAWAAPARLSVAYPGLWVRPDVYATHGHYLDCHLTIPTLERLTMGAMLRVLRRTPAELRGAGDYEAIGSPVFAWRDAVARDARTGSALNGIATVSAWRALGGGVAGEGSPNASRRTRRGRGASRAQRLRMRALAAGFPLAVAALNRAGLGPLRTDISGEELRKAGLRAIGDVAEGLGLGAAHVVFGHTHRTGPLPGDEQDEWRTPAGGRLYNTGSWTYASIFLTDTPGESPYWPGGAVLVEDEGPPLLRRLLQDRTREQIRPSPLRRRPARPGMRAARR
jgi:predicted phosphodiesterase